MKFLRKQQCPLFIFGSGRSGTTLVQRIINSTEQATIWGETGNSLNLIARSYALNYEPHSPSYSAVFSKHDKGIGVRQAKSYLRDPTHWSAWTTWFGREEFLRCYQSLISSLYNPKGTNTKYWGFKEVRLDSVDILQFLLELYPNAKFVFATRHPVDVVKSQVHNFPNRRNQTFEEFIEHYIVEIHNIIKFIRRHPHNCHIIGFEDLVRAPDAELTPLFHFLGLSLTDRQRQVISLEEGSNPAGWKRMDESEKQVLGDSQVALISETTKKGFAFLHILKKHDCFKRLHFEDTNNYELRPLRSLEGRFLYLPIPGVASTSLKYSLHQLHEFKYIRRRLRNPDFFHQFEEKDLSIPFIYAFVRNPWDRLVSCYANKLQSNSDRNRDAKKGIVANLSKHDLFKEDMTFEEFVSAVSKIPDASADIHFRSQYTYLYDWQNRLIPNFIGRFEDLWADYRFVARKIGLPNMELSRGAKSDQADFRPMYTDEAKKLVEERYRADITIFGYTFD